MFQNQALHKQIKIFRWPQQNGEKLCPCPEEDEEIEINFDELEKHLKSVEETGNDLTSSDLTSIQEPEPLDLSLKEAEDLELDKEVLEENMLASILEEEIEEKIQEKLGENYKIEDHYDNEISDNELEEDLKESLGKLNEKKKVNPWAVCHSSVGLEDSTKFEHCVQDIKAQQSMKENKNLVKSQKFSLKEEQRKHSSLLFENKQLKQKNQKLIRRYDWNQGKIFDVFKTLGRIKSNQRETFL